MPNTPALLPEPGLGELVLAPRGAVGRPARRKVLGKGDFNPADTDFSLWLFLHQQRD